MDARHAHGEFEAIGMGSDASFDLVGSQVSMCEFVRWLHCVDVTRVQVHHVANLVLRCRSVMSIVVLH